VSDWLVPYHLGILIPSSTTASKPKCQKSQTPKVDIISGHI
jgi:hypothetical protein